MPEASSGSADIPMFFLTELVSVNACRTGVKSLLAPLLLQESRRYDIRHHENTSAPKKNTWTTKEKIVGEKNDIIYKSVLGSNVGVRWCTCNFKLNHELLSCCILNHILSTPAWI